MIAAAGVGATLLATHNGIGTTGDSAAYLMAGRNIAAGKGVVLDSVQGPPVPLTWYPPIYPALVAVAVRGFADPTEGMRYVQAAIFGLNILLLGILVRGPGSDERRFVSVAAALAFATSVSMLAIHSFMFSEGLFITFFLTALIALESFLERRSLAALLAVALAAGLATLTRWTGVAMVVTFGIAIAYYAKRRLRDALLYGVAVGALVGLWVARNYASGGRVTGRKLALHLPTHDQFTAAFDTFATWLVPTQMPAVGVAAAIAIGLGLLAALLAARWHFGRDGAAAAQDLRLADTLLLFCAAYVALVVLSITFADANTYPDHRILAPVFVALVIWLARCGPVAARLARAPRLLRPLLIGGFVLFLAISCVRAAVWVRRSYATGLGLAESRWKTSATLAYVKSLPPETLVYTTDTSALYLVAGRLAYGVPRAVDVSSTETNEALDDQLAAMRARLTERNGVVVELATGPDHLGYDLAQRGRLTIEQQFPDGVIYRAPSEH